MSRFHRLGALFLLLGACAAAPLRVASTPATLTCEQLAGTWHVVATNFPMWTKGSKTSPTFTYALRPDGTLSDVVGYLEDGKPGTIEGVDTQDPKAPAHFTWRGLGWLALFSSAWDVAALDPAGEWAVISFAATLATPEGVDVIFRTPPSDEALAQVLSFVAAEPALRARAAGLLPLRHR
jgi:lipocalin